MKVPMMRIICSSRLSLVLGLISGAVVVLIWSGWLLISRYGVQGELSIWDIALIRFGIAALAVIPLVLMRPLMVSQICEPRVVIAALNGGILYVLFSFAGLKLAEASNAGILVNGMLPVIGVLLLLLYGVRPNAFQICGIVIVVGANLSLIGGGAISAPALVMLLAAATSLSLYMFMIGIHGLKMEVVVVAIPVINAIVCLPLWLAFDGILTDAPMSEIALQAVYQGLIVSLIGTALFTICIHRAGSLMAALLMAFVPVTTPLLDGIVSGVSPDIALITIATVTTAGIALCAVGAAFPKRSPISNE